jgi:hypothetical protein
VAVKLTTVPDTACPLASTTFTANAPAELPTTALLAGAVAIVTLEAPPATTGPEPESEEPHAAAKTSDAAAAAVT